MLYVALLVMTMMLVAFSIAWYLSPRLRESLEEPKYRILDNAPDKSD